MRVGVCLRGVRVCVCVCVRDVKGAVCQFCESSVCAARHAYMLRDSTTARRGVL
jgi:hypothetical protein